MIDGGLRENNEGLRELLEGLERKEISDPRVLDAIAQTPREIFISEPELKPHAYEDEALPIECGQTISQPFIVAYMTERLNVMPDHDVLEIGTGSGYQTAILACLARHVYTIESYWPLHRLAEERFEQLGLANITAIHSDGTMGWPDGRTFDRIIVTAGTNEVPPALLAQLAPCGCMVIPLGLQRRQNITLVTRDEGGEHFQRLLPVRFVPLLPREVAE
jgi:protein-L-isoaspartate(D-aspartate) O-methyltransferase